MSRPNLPQLSWRQLRIASAAALAVMMTTAIITEPAGSEDPPARTAALTPSMSMLGRPMTRDTRAAQTALTAQAKAQAAAHRQAVEKAQKARQERQARERAAAEAAAARERAEAAAAARERARVERAHQRAARSAHRQQAATLTTATASGSVSGARSWARSRLSAAQYQCLSQVVSRESGWNHRASNPTSGAYGLFQALPGSKMASAGSDWQSNPLTQMRWGLSYMQGRYGSPCGAWYFWTKNGWY
ncbi:transglycosylase SLT domain-containing protein [Streptomyces sp. Midd1]|uniref:aggregation-promoting factor C-terminal-like domain-containing protein n=1 Tax=Streptomyces sp. Midd3 TaxID=3161191 RepID=UPI0034DAD5DB